jgi:stearoyl-CoA desaturase (delta-9 desaturase)
MMKTKRIYHDFVRYKTEPEASFKGNYPVWKALDRIGDLWSVRILFGIGYTLFYIYFATAWWQFLFLPIHYLIGPVQGAVVNWCGHKYGYSNYNNDDHSRNSLPVDFLLMGELMQNNHHKSPNNPNFARRWFEMDPTWPFMRLLHGLHIIRLRRLT